MLSYCVYFSEIVFSLKTKISTGQLSCRAFQLSSEGAIPGRYPRRSILLFQASRHGQFHHIAFVRDVDIDCGTLISREPQTRRLCKHSLNCSQCNKYHQAIGGEKENEILVFVLNVKIYVQARLVTYPEYTILFTCLTNCPNQAGNMKNAFQLRCVR